MNAQHHFQAELECGDLGIIPAQVFYEYTPAQPASRDEPGETEFVEIVSIVARIPGISGKQRLKVSQECENDLKTEAINDWKTRWNSDLVDARMAA